LINGHNSVGAAIKDKKEAARNGDLIRILGTILRYY